MIVPVTKSGRKALSLASLLDHGYVLWTPPGTGPRPFPILRIRLATGVGSSHDMAAC